MIYIIAVRYAGDKQGDDIVNSLITSEECAKRRGQTELNRNELSSRVDMTTVYRTGVRMGHVAESHDAIYGETWRGKIIGITHNYTKTSKKTKLSMYKYRTD